MSWRYRKGKQPGRCEPPWLWLGAKALLQERRNPAGPERPVRVPITELPDR